MNTAARSHRVHARGFTLLEMAIVLFILGLLIAGLIGPVEVQIEARDRYKTHALMEQVIEALYGFALTNRRLPCPDQDGDGMPDPAFDPASAASAQCTVATGFLPWAVLGVEPGDAWGNRLDYRVRSPDFTWPAQDATCNGDSVHELDLCTHGNILIKTRGDDATTGGVSEGKHLFDAATPSNVAAVILSHGRNGYGATSVSGTLRGGVPADNVDEAENADGDATFMLRNYSRAQNGCADDANESTPLCEYDDLVMSVSRAILNSRMVSAGQLP